MRHFSRGIGEVVGIIMPAGTIHKVLTKGLERGAVPAGEALLNTRIGRAVVSGNVGGLFGMGTVIGEDVAKGQAGPGTLERMMEQGSDDALAFMIFHLGGEAAIEGITKLAQKAPGWSKSIKNDLKAGFYRVFPDAAPNMTTEEILEMLKDPDTLSKMKKVPKVKEALGKVVNEVNQQAKTVVQRGSDLREQARAE